jgi:hypothetical protein
MFGYHKERSFYLLSNGLLAVDQSELNKANPYYICYSFEDYYLIAQYLHIYYVDVSSGPMVECRLHEHFLIKKFLETEPLNLIQERSDEVFKFFITEERKCVYVRYNHNPLRKHSDNRNMKKMYRSLIDKKLRNEDEIYYSLVIYQSLDVMNLLGVFEDDDIE